MDAASADREEKDCRLDPGAPQRSQSGSAEVRERVIRGDWESYDYTSPGGSKLRYSLCNRQFLPRVPIQARYVLGKEYASKSWALTQSLRRETHFMGKDRAAGATEMASTNHRGESLQDA